MIAREGWHGAAVLAGLLLLWEVLVGHRSGSSALLPPPSVIFVSIGQLFADGDIWDPVSTTLKRLLIGFSICTLGGTVLGIATGSIRLLSDTLEPLLEAIRSLPKVALVPALMLFVGIGDATNIISISLAGLFPVWLNVVRGVRHIDPVLRESAQTLALGRYATFSKVILPSILPDAFAGARIALGLCFVVAVLSEMTMGSDGLGSLIIDTQRSFKVRQMYAWVFILAAIGFAMNTILLFAERRIVFWTGMGLNLNSEEIS